MSVLRRYFPRQVLDLSLTRGVAAVIVGIVFSLPVWIGVMSVPEADPIMALGPGLEGTATFLIMIVTYGVIGEDVRHGYYRFLFAKPINPVLYYALAMVAAFSVFLVAEMILVGTFAVFYEPVWPIYVLMEVVVSFILLGSVIFAVSRLTRLDWLVGLTLLILGSVVRGWYPAAESIRGKILNVILPPVQLVETSLFSDGVLWRDLSWIGAYSAVCIAIGLSLVRFIPLSNNR